MNWKPASIAAVIVTLAGFGVGVLVGGKKTTRTETVLRTVTVGAAHVPSTDTTSSTGDTTTTNGQPGPSAPVGAPSSPLGDQSDLFATDNLSVDSSVTVEQIGRQRYQDSVIVYPLGNAPAEKGTLLTPIPGPQYKTLRATIGFKAGTPSQATLVVDVRANAPEGTELLDKPVKLKGSIAQQIDVPLGDAQSVVFVFDDPTCTRNASADECRASDSTFVIGDAHFQG